MTPVAGARRRKALGQHFLTDGRVADRILDYARIAPQERVLEIGPGPGILTQRLATRARHVVAVEKDPHLAERLRVALPPDAPVQVELADATRADLAAWGPYDKIVANLPYSVSTPITFRILPLPWQEAVLMYQREFAQRLVAPGPGDAHYGRLAAARAYFAQADYLETVPPGAFRPPPRVASGIVRLTRHASPPFTVGSPQGYLELLRVVFSTRRKTLRATFRHQHAALGLHAAEDAEALLETTGHGTRRPEELTPEELGQLSVAWEAVRGSP